MNKHADDEIFKTCLHVLFLSPSPSNFIIIQMGTYHLTDRMDLEPILSVNANLTETVRVNKPLPRLYN